MRLAQKALGFASTPLICLQTMLLPKLYVVGSIPIARSICFTRPLCRPTMLSRMTPW